jgi:nucleoid DNA-binding protein
MGKFSLSNIAEELAAKSGITRDASTNFVHSLIEVIEKGLQEDGMVKIKGLGTFKLQEMSDRVSVDVNTGERITIKGYPLFALLMPALFNALLVGWELEIYIGGGFWLNALYVAIGEAAVLLTLGSILFYVIRSRHLDSRLFG